MAGYKIFFKKSIEKDLRSIDKENNRRILQRIELLASDPRPPGCENLTGQELYRIRQGNYRIIYSVQDEEVTVWIIKIGHRRDVYR